MDFVGREARISRAVMSKLSINYLAGEEARVGDIVSYHLDRAVVEEVIISEQEMRQWGVNESGLMLTTSFGRVFTGPRHVEDWEDLEFLSRGTKGRA
jgi:hypothetical protein